MDATVYLAGLRREFEKNTQAEDAFFMAKYMKNKFSFFGLKNPLRKAIVRAYIEKNGHLPDEEIPAFSLQCFEAPEREIHYLLKDILLPRRIGKLGADYLGVIESLIPIHSWWDSIDFLSPKLAGPLLMKYPELQSRYPDQWIESENIWFQRSAILFQLDYKDKMDTNRLKYYLRSTAASDAFFVQKAAGWILRQYSKYNAPWVQNFIKTEHLSPLTEREGLKWLSRP